MSIENTMVRPENLHPQRVKFLIILFCLVPAYEKKRFSACKYIFMYSEHKDSPVLPY